MSDLLRLMRAPATGARISKEALELMLAPRKVGQGRNAPERYFSLGMELVQPWIPKTFAFGGYAGIAGYLPSADLTLAVVTTHGRNSNPGENRAKLAFAEIASMLGR